MRAAALALAAVLLAFLTGCAPTEGTVKAKRYTPDRTWYATEPVYGSQSYPCSKTRTTYRCGKSLTTYYTTTCRRRVQIGTEQVQHWSPARYRLRIVNGDESGWVTVDRGTYRRASVGDYYKNGSVR